MDACGKPCFFSHQRGVASVGDRTYFFSASSTVAATINATFAGLLLVDDISSCAHAAQTCTETVFKKKDDQSRRQCHSYSAATSPNGPALASSECSEVRLYR